MRKLFIIAAAALMAVACNKAETNETAETRQITFRTSGFTQTRDSQPMTDIWLFDYRNGELLQSVHQSSSDPDFGSPTLTMACGSHTIYCAASRGTEPTLEAESHSISFSKPDDTFWNTMEINVTPETAQSQTITLNRVVAKLTLVIEDEVMTGTTAFNVTPHTWHCGLDYLTGQPYGTSVDKQFMFDCLPSMIGISYKQLSIFGFSQQDVWNTDVTLQAMGTEGPIAEAYIPDVPLAANRATTYTGKLYVLDVNGFVILNDEWGDPFNGGW